MNNNWCCICNTNQDHLRLGGDDAGHDAGQTGAVESIQVERTGADGANEAGRGQRSAAVRVDAAQSAADRPAAGPARHPADEEARRRQLDRFRAPPQRRCRRVRRRLLRLVVGSQQSGLQRPLLLQTEESQRSFPILQSQVLGRCIAQEWF